MPVQPDMTELLHLQWKRDQLAEDEKAAREKRQRTMLEAACACLPITILCYWVRSVPWLVWLIVPLVLFVRVWFAHDKAAELEDKLDITNDKLKVTASRIFADKATTEKYLNEHNSKFKGMRLDMEEWEQ